MSGLSQSNRLTMAAVFLPMPRNRSSSACTSSFDSFRKYSMDVAPRSLWIVCRMCWIHTLFLGASPAHLMAAATSATLAVRTSSHLLKRSFSCSNARCELVFVVFCDRMVPTIVSRSSRFLARFPDGRLSPKSFARAAWIRTTSFAVGDGNPAYGDSSHRGALAGRFAAAAALEGLAVVMRMPCEKVLPTAFRFIGAVFFAG
mmetsp:Transcript_50128/g.129303  ORF Transcript_50128/g.129303 Transcript_50128/m.129303 type:complete len:202 (+) Transcript_50128:459-1064(+)